MKTSQITKSILVACLRVYFNTERARSAAPFPSTVTAAVLGCALSLILQTHSIGKPAAEIQLWPQGLPDNARPLSDERLQELRAKNTFERIAVVTEPTLTVFPAPIEKANGTAVVICPGGGYNILAWPKEGVEVAEWLNSLGVTAAVLKYRVPRRDPDIPHRWPLQDVQRAIRLVRDRADQWKVKPNRVGVLGFSAGGHLAVMAGTHWDQPSYSSVDKADRKSCRPDFLIPIYAAYLGQKADPYRLDSLVTISEQTPPTFMAVTYDDKMRAVHAALLLVELKKFNVPAELHIYTRGGHGYGLRPSENPVSSWPARCADWLRAMKLIHESADDGG